MLRLTIGDAVPNDDSEISHSHAPEQQTPPADVANVDRSNGRRTIHDPCSGSGRILLAAAQINRHWEFCGQDVDIRCVRMTALNLAFRNLYGYVIWGNTLALEQKLVYRTGFDGRGFLRQVPLEACPAPVQCATSAPSETHLDAGSEPPIAGDGKGRQLELF